MTPQYQTSHQYIFLFKGVTLRPRLSFCRFQTALLRKKNANRGSNSPNGVKKNTMVKFYYDHSVGLPEE